MTTTSKELGEEIVHLRKRRDLTQRKLAEKIGITNVHLCNIERGRGKGIQKLSMLQKIAKALRCQLKIRFVP